jgi:HAD superfamily hydrolase (TIGR01459 family)
MKIIKPIVGISKIIDNYDVVVCGFNGVLYDGEHVKQDAVDALTKCAASGKKVVIATNSSLRVAEICDILSGGRAGELNYLSAVVSAGEVLHYCLKNPQHFGLAGNQYYNLGNQAAEGVFDGLNYIKSVRPEGADFAFIGMVNKETDVLDDYARTLEHCFALGLPLVAAGNDVSTYYNGQISLGSGAVAEQYAVMGGVIYTVGKPAPDFVKYAIECVTKPESKVLFIGDGFATDIKSANMINADAVLISKGIHVNYLGEGYIPDVEKARNLAMNFDVYPDYVISGLRW